MCFRYLANVMVFYDTVYNYNGSLCINIVLVIEAKLLNSLLLLLYCVVYLVKPQLLTFDQKGFILQDQLMDISMPMSSNAYMLSCWREKYNPTLMLNSSIFEDT